LSKINILFITNGLGNTLFQSAFAELLSLNTREKVIVKDYIAYPHFFTKYILKWNFHEEDCIDYSKFKKDFNVYDIFALLIIFFISRFNRLFLISNYYSVSFFNRKYYHGYYQEIKNNLNSESIKKNCFKYITFREDLLNNNYADNLKNVLIIHIRHGDFEKEDQLGLDFYTNAFLEIVKLSSKHFVDIKIIGVSSKRFTKSLMRSLSKLSSKKIKFLNLTNKSKIKDDFLTIWNAQYFIASNSTFAFWASWGRNKYIAIPYSSRKMYCSVSDLNTFHKVILV